MEEQKKKIIKEIAAIEEDMRKPFFQSLPSTEKLAIIGKLDDLKAQLQDIFNEETSIADGAAGALQGEDLGYLIPDESYSPAKDPDFDRDRELKEIDEKIIKEEAEGNPVNLVRNTPGEGKLMLIEMSSSENKELQKKAKTFFNYIYDKYSSYFPQLLLDTQNFRNQRPGAPVFYTTIYDRYLYQDIMSIATEHQNKKWGKRMGEEILRFAVENDLVVLATAVNQDVQDSMMTPKDGVIKGWKIGPDLMVFTVKEDLPRVQTRILEDWKANKFFINDDAWLMEYQSLLDKFNQLTDDEKINLQNRFNERNKSNNYKGLDTQKLIGELLNGTSPVDVDWTQYVFHKEGQYILNALHLDQSTKAFDREALLLTNDLEDIVQREFIETHIITDLPTDIDYDIGFRHWLVNTNEGRELYIQLVEVLENNNRDTDDIDLKKLKENILNTEIVKQHLELINQENINKVNDRHRLSGRMQFENLEKSQLWNGDFSEDDEKLLKNLYDKTYRNSFINYLDQDPIFTWQEILSSLTNERLGENNNWLKFDINGNHLSLYRAASPIDAALGLRVPDWRPNGGRTSGHGSNNYFATTSNYTQDYRVFNRPTYRYDINISDWNDGDILDYTSNLSRMDRKIILLALQDDPILSNLHRALSKTHDGRIGGSKFVHRTFGSAIQATRLMGNKQALPRLIDALRIAGYKAIVHQWTGRPGHGFLNYVTPRGFERIHTDGRDRLQEEFLLLNPQNEEVEVYELTNSRGATGRSDTLFGDDFKPINPRDVIVNDIARIFDPDQSEIMRHGVYTYLSDIRKDLQNEFNNRAEIIDEIIPKKQRDEIFQAIENISLYVVDEFDAAKAEGREPDYKNVGNRILKEGGVDGLYIVKQLDNNSLLPLFDPGMQGNVDTIPINELGVTFTGQKNLLQKRITLPNGTEYYAAYQIVTRTGDNEFTLLGEFGIEEKVKLDSNWRVLTSTSSNQTNIYPFDEDYLTYKRGEEVEPRKSIIFNQEDNLHSTNVPPIENVEDLPSTSIDKPHLTGTLQHLFATPHKQKILVDLFHVSPDGPVSINDVRAGVLKTPYPVSDKYGNVEWKVLNNFLDGRNVEADVALSLGFDKEFLFDNYEDITGKRTGVPNKTLNGYKAILNTDEIITMYDLYTGNWFNAFDLQGAANALGVPKEDLIKIMAKHNIIKINNFVMEGQELMFQDGRLLGLDKVLQFTDNLQQLPQLRNTNNRTIMTKFLRGGGIEGYILYPNYKHTTHPELVLLDPNDQIGLGKYVDIVDTDTGLLEGNYQIVDEDTKPLRTYDEIGFVSDQEVIDNAYDTRLTFDKGFRTVQDNALGLTGDVPELVSNNIFDNNTVRAVVEHGNKLDFDTVNNAREIIMGHIEEPLKLSQAEATQQLLEAARAGNLIDVHNLTLRQQALERASLRLARSVATRGMVGTGFLLLDILELSTITAAALYGTSDYWTAYLSDGINDITNGVLGTDYDMETVEVDMEQYIGALETADKVSPFSYLYKSIANKPLMQTLGQYDFVGGFRQTSPLKRPGVVQTALTSAVALVSPGITTEDLLPPEVSINDIVNMEANPGYSFIGPVRHLGDFPEPDAPELRQPTEKETRYMNASPWGRVWMDYKDNYNEYRQNRINKQLNRSLLGTIERHSVKDSYTPGFYGRILTDIKEEDY